MNSFKSKETSASTGGSVYFQNSKNTEIAELQAELNSMKLDQQKEAMKQIIASMTIGKDVSALFPHVVKCMRTTNVELKKLIYLYIINYAKAKPDLTFLAVAAFHSDAMDKNSPLIRALAVRTMGCIRVNMIVSYLCETLTNCLKDEDPYVRKTACTCVAKLYNTSPGLVKENGFLTTLTNMLTDGNAVVVANSLASLLEISILSGENYLKLRSKVLKRVLAALNEANEWGQVYILDALSFFSPKKPKQAEEIIEAVIPRLVHSNSAVVMSAVKVVLKFLDYIDSIENVKNYCKKISSSLMSVMMSGPEIQYVLLRSLHAVVQKRPYLLDKDFKYFYVQYNDPIYVKLEKIDILYKLCDAKNFESIVNELKSYAKTEYDSDLVKRAIRYIGFIGYKFDKSLDLCVESLKDILEHNTEFTLSEGIVVARDLMRKYKGKSLELLKKIDEDFIKQISEPEAKAALLFILGEFCVHIKNSTELISPFVECFNEEVPAVKLQILNCVIKNYVNKPDESEDLVKACLQRGAEESDNPDVRDRAYMYWRLLEIDPDIAKEMITGEKAPFEFREELNFDGELVDNIINNMTNISAAYHKTSQELVPKEDMIMEENGEDKEKSTNEVKEKETSSTKKKEEKSPEKTSKIIQSNVNVMDADLLGLEDDHGTNNNNVIPSSNSNSNTMNIFDIFGGTSTNNNTPVSSTNQFNNFTNLTTPQPEVSMDDFGFVVNDSNTFDESNIQIFQDNGLTPSVSVNVFKSNDISVYSSFSRENGKILFGLFIVNKSKSPIDKLGFNFAPNSFGINIANPNRTDVSISPNNGDKIIFNVEIDNNKNDKKPPQTPFRLTAKLITFVTDETLLNIPLLLNSLFIENARMQNNAFVEFFKNNNANPFNLSYVINNIINLPNEEALTKKLERNNIMLVAKQTKFDPPLLYFSLNVSGVIPAIIECSFIKGTSNLKMRIIANLEVIAPLIKEVNDYLIN